MKQDNKTKTASVTFGKERTLSTVKLTPY